MGPSKGASVNVFSLGEDSSETYVAGPFVVDEKGKWAGSISKQFSGPLIMAVSGGNYLDPVSGKSIALDIEDTLYGFLLYGNEVTISPFTHVVYEAAREFIEDGVPQENAITWAAAEVHSKFGFNTAKTVPTLSADADEQQKKYAALLGGLKLLLADPALEAFSDTVSFNVVKAFSKDLADGKLDGLSGSRYPILVSLRELGISPIPFPALDRDGVEVLITAANEYSKSESMLNGVSLPSTRLKLCAA